MKMYLIELEYWDEDFDVEACPNVNIPVATADDALKLYHNICCDKRYYDYYDHPTSIYLRVLEAPENPTCVQDFKGYESGSGFLVMDVEIDHFCRF